MSHLFVPKENPHSPVYKNKKEKKFPLLLAGNTITRVVEKHKYNNDILQYLIILTKEDYQSGTFSKSTYEKIKNKKHLFNGILNIEKLEDFISSTEPPLIDKLPINNKYQIDGNITPRILYIRLPKEKLYVSSDVFQERCLDSKMNELISIFSTLQAKSIKISVIHENASNIKLNIGAGANVKGINVDANINSETDKSNKISTTREITFQDPENSEKLNVELFGDYNKFFYLPKDESWINIIRRRVNNKSSGDDYKYNYKDYNCVSKELSTQLKFLHINLQYNSSQYEKLIIEYDVDYFPCSQDLPKVAEVAEIEPLSGFDKFVDTINPLNIFKLFN